MKIPEVKLTDARREMFYAELHALLTAGLDFSNAFRLLIEGEEDRRMKALLERLYACVVRGDTLAQAMTGQPAIVGYEGTSEMLTNGIKVFGETKVGWMGDKLQSGALGTMGEAFRVLGIPHLQFEKSERLITNEARGTLSSTYLSMLDRLNGRKRALSWLHDNGWPDAQVRLAPWLGDMFTSLMENERGSSSSSVFGSSGGE